MGLESDGEEDLLQRLNAMEGQIAGNVFGRLGQWRSSINVLKAVMQSLEEAEEPSERCLEVVRNMFERWQGKVVADLAEARAEMEDVRARLEQAGHAQEAARAGESVEKIEAARSAGRVSAEFLEELDHLHGALLSPLIFGKKDTMTD